MEENKTITKTTKSRSAKPKQTNSTKQLSTESKIFAGGITALIVCLVCSIAAFVIAIGNHNKIQSIPSYCEQCLIERMEIQTYAHYYNAKDQLIDSIDTYIKTFAPKSGLHASKFLELSDKYNVDVRFMLAQGHLESAFGTAGIAASTNSVFNVGAFDGKNVTQIHGRYKYNHPDFSIEPYLVLLTEKYMDKKKSELDLMLPGQFKTVISGKRYASAPDYEQKLTNIYTNIDNIVNISDIYSEYRKYKTIVEMQ